MIVHPISALAFAAFASVTALPLLATTPMFALYVESNSGRVDVQEHDVTGEDCEAAALAWRAFPDIKSARCIAQGK